MSCTVHIDCGVPRETEVKFDYNRADFEGFKRELRGIDWTLLLQGDAQNCWNIFKNMMQDLEKQYVPLRKYKGCGKHKPIWMTHKAASLVQKKRKVYAKYKNNDHPAVRKIVAKSTKEIKKARRSFEKKLAKNIKQDKKSFFAYMRSKCKSRTQVGTLTNKTGSCLDGIHDIVSEFNDYFTTVFTLENTEDLPEPVKIFKGQTQAC